MTELEKEIAHLKELQAKHRRNIRTLEEMLAEYGMERPLHLVNSLDFEREQLRQVEERLAELTVQAKTEEAPGSPAEPAAGPRAAQVSVTGSGAAAVGERATSAGEGGMAVGGDVVYGDKVGGDKVAGDKVTVSTHVRDVHGGTVITAGRDVTYTASTGGDDPTLLEASYLRRVQVSCNALPLAVIDPRAVERTRQQTMDLLAVYVALDTQTPVVMKREEGGLEPTEGEEIPAWLRILREEGLEEPNLEETPTEEEEIPAWLRILREEGLEEPNLEETPAEEAVAEAAVLETEAVPVEEVASIEEEEIPAWLRILREEAVLEAEAAPVEEAGPSEEEEIPAWLRILRREGLEEPDRKPLTALETAARERQMVLLGDPGSGKSTFANYLSLCLAGARLERLGKTSALPGDEWLVHLKPAWTHGPLLPLQIMLRHFAGSNWCDGTAAGLWNFVEDTLAAQGLADFGSHLRQQLLDGGVMVLLDGLDEVADPEERKTVRNAVADFAATYGHPANRYLVTCRGYAYQDPRWQLERFAVHTLAPFNQKQIDDFVGCWYKEVCRLGWKSEIEAEDLTHRLQAATRRSDLAPLARSPLQLTMMASLHFSWGRLPDDRVEPYQEMVRLLLVRWQEARLGKDVGVTQAVSAGKLESALERVAFTAHHAQEGPEGTADVGEVVLRSVLKDYLEGSWDRAGELVTYIQERAGLLIERGPGVYTFPHRSYQEYLAGSYLAVQPDFPDEVVGLIRENYAQWREVVLWAVGVMARLKKMIHVAVDVAAALCPHEVPDQAVSEADWRSAYLASEALLEVGLEEVKARERHRQVLARVRGWLMAPIERGVLTPVQRATGGDMLARLGDPRPGTGLHPDGLPDVIWCEVPVGDCGMGEGYPKHHVDLSAYSISKYPVTNAQYAAFVQGNGYAEKWHKCWTEAGWRWKEDRTGPTTYGGVFDLPNRPVVGVSWYEAVAFCRWLTERLREIGEIRPDQEVSLPTEAQWEKAARGEDGRIYPWGDEFDAAKCNVYETGIGTTSAVGIFPAGASPYGVLDLSGNVWEWCRTKWRDSYKEPADESLEGMSLRVLRGGSFEYSRGSARCAFRFRNSPNFRDSIYGFRLCLVSQQE